MKTATKARMPGTLVWIAKGQLGVREIKDTNCGPQVDEYKAATWLNPKKGWPWCAAFICWLVREALINSGTKQTKTFKRPRTAGAWDLANWSLRQDRSTVDKALSTARHRARRHHRLQVQPLRAGSLQAGQERPLSLYRGQQPTAGAPVREEQSYASAATFLRSVSESVSESER